MKLPEGDACDRCGAPVRSTKVAADDGSLSCDECELRLRAAAEAARFGECAHCRRPFETSALWTLRTISPSGETCEEWICDDCRDRLEDWLRFWRAIEPETILTSRVRRCPCGEAWDVKKRPADHEYAGCHELYCPKCGEFALDRLARLDERIRRYEPLIDDCRDDGRAVEADAIAIVSMPSRGPCSRDEIEEAHE